MGFNSGFKGLKFGFYMELSYTLLFCHVLDLVLPSTGSVYTVDDFCSVSEVNTSQVEAELCRQPRGREIN